MANWKKTMMASAGGGGGPYFILEYGTGNNENSTKMVLDDDDNIYLTGYTPAGPSSYQHATLNKVDNNGSIQMSYNYGDNFAPNGNEVARDGSGNLAIICSGFITTDPGIIYTNSSGTVQWCRRLFMGYGYGKTGVFDSSGNIYIAGSSSEMSGGSGFCYKINSSGTLQNQMHMDAASSSSDDWRDMTIDSSGSVLCVGFYYDSYYNPWLVKMSSSLGVTFSKNISYSGNFGWLEGVVTDSSNNIYTVGQQRIGDTSNYQMMITKLNSSGTHQWSRKIGNTNGSTYANGIDVDSDGNVYAVGYNSTVGQGSNEVVIVKYDNSGTLQFQRFLGTTGSDTPAGGIKINSSGDMVISGWGSGYGYGGNDKFIAKLPNDGSKTGTYGSWTYQAGNLTEGSHTALTSVVNKGYSTSSPAYLEAETVNRYTTSYSTNLESI